MSLQTMQGVTPTIIVRFPQEIDLTDAEHVYVSFRQGVKLLRLDEGFDVSAHQVDVYLEQAQTLMFIPGEMTMQVNWTYPSGQRGATKKIRILVDSNHLLEVLP